MQMAESSDIAIIRSIASLQLITISISNSFGHRKWQAGSSKDMAAIDRSDKRVDEAQNVGRVLCVGWRYSGSQDSEARKNA